MMKLGRMSKFVLLISPLALTTATGTFAQDQHPILDKIAAKVIEKYQTTPCAELMQKKANPQPPSPEEVKAVQYLKSNPQVRTILLIKSPPQLPTKCLRCENR